MAQITNFFLGANSGSGFQNLFSEIMDPETAFDIMILKGGPGVGKNTFMREIGRTMEQAGADVEYLWCSGDPDSLGRRGDPGTAVRRLRWDIAPRRRAEVPGRLWIAMWIWGGFTTCRRQGSQAGEVKRHTPRLSGRPMAGPTAV